MLKKLKSLFIVEEEDTQQPAEQEEKKNPQATKPTPSTPKATPSPARIPEEAVDPEVMEKLLSAIESNNQSGFDYLEFKHSLKALEKIPMDEANRFRSAFATASTMGVTLEKLTDSVAFYLDVLKREESKFSHALADNTNNNIAKKEEEHRLINKLIEEKKEQIKLLTKEIEEHQTKSNDVLKEVEQAKQKIESTKSKFINAYNHLKSQFEKDAEKLQQYLK